MLNINEIYYLNRALDGKKIYGLDNREYLTSDLKNIEKSLIKKNFLQENGSLNKLSFIVIKNLKEFKECSKYLWINDMVVALKDNNEIIYFKKISNENVIFNKLTKDFLLYQIIKDYKFIRDYKPVEDKEEIIIYPREFIKKYASNISGEEILYIKKEEAGEIGIYNIYYIKEDRPYKYDALEGILKEINPKDIREELVIILDRGGKGDGR